MDDFQMRFESVRMATQIVCSGKIPAQRLGEAFKEIYEFLKLAKSTAAKAKRRK